MSNTKRMPSSLMERLFAFIVDYSIIAMLLLLVFWLLKLDGFADLQKAFDSLFRLVFMDTYKTPNLMIYFPLVAYGVYVLYSIGMEAGMAKTIGKHVVGISVTDEEGDKPNIVAVLIRNGLKIVSFALAGLGYFASSLMPDKAAAHDYLAKTRVVRD